MSLQILVGLARSTPNRHWCNAAVAASNAKDAVAAQLEKVQKAVK